MSCRCCATKNRKPTSAMTLRRLTISAPLKLPGRNRRMSSIGVRARSCRRTKSTPKASPASIGSHAATANPCTASSLMP